MKIEQFQFPSDWKLCPIADSFEFTGKPRGLDLSKNGDTIPFFPMDQIPLGRIHVSQFTPKPLADLGSGTYVENGDLMVAKITPSFENGKQAIVDIKTDFAYATTEVIPMRGRQGESDTLFLFFYLLHPEIRSDLAGKMEGSTGRQRLSKTVLGDRLIPLPPLAEQKKIAHILSTVQRAIEVQERIIQTTVELKKALLHKLFTEGLRHEPQKQTKIGPVPESWEVVKVQDLVDRKILDKPIDGNHGEIHPKVSDFVPAGIPFIMASDLKGGLVDLKTCNFLTKERADRLRKGFSLPGDVLISHKATIGETAIVPDVEHYIMLTPQVTYYRVLNNDALSNEYLRCYFDSPTFQTSFKNVASDGSTRAYIGITKQRDLSVLLPMIEEQRELAKVFRCLDGKLRQSIATKNAFTALFRTLLHELMTAKVLVNNLTMHNGVVRSQ